MKISERIPNIFHESLYYEAHVTVEPLFGMDLVTFQTLCHRNKFKAADLLMVKNRQATEERSDKDSFCTARSSSKEDLLQRIRNLVVDLEQMNIRVWRYKIENVIMDVKWSR